MGEYISLANATNMQVLGAVFVPLLKVLLFDNTNKIIYEGAISQPFAKEKNLFLNNHRNDPSFLSESR